MRTKLIVLPLLMLLLISLVIPASADTTATVTPLSGVTGQVGGVTSVVAFSGGQLFFNIGPRIVRMDVSSSTPGQPTKPETYGGILPGIPEDIKVANGYVYVAMGNDGVAVVDAVTLDLLSIQKLPGTSFAAAVAVGPEALYVAGGYAGVIVYDLGVDYKTLTFGQTHTFSPLRNVTDIETMTVSANTYLFVAANNYSAIPANRGGVLQFDITTAALLSAPVNAKEEIDVNALAVNSAYVYAGGDSEFYVLDIPHLGGASGVFATLALTNSAIKMALGPDGSYWVYLISPSGIDVVNVFVPTAPILETTTPFSTQGSVMGLVAVEFASDAPAYLYLADYHAGLSIASSAHESPETLTLNSPSYILPKPAITSAVAGIDHQAFAVSNSASIQTIDTNVPITLTAVGTAITTTDSIYSLVTYEDWLLASAGGSGLLRYQINPGGSPTSLDSYVTGGTAYDAAVSWPNAYVADGANGLVVVNISGTLGLAGFASAPEFDSEFHAVDVQGNYAYIADNNGNFRIYDVTDPSGPIPDGYLPQAGILDVKASGNFAFLACGAAGVRVVDVTQPMTPTFVTGADYNTPGMAQSLVVYQNYLFVADGSSGVQVLTIQPDGGLDLLGTFATSDRAVSLAFETGYLYVADQNGGLVVIQSPLFWPHNLYLPLVTR